MLKTTKIKIAAGIAAAAVVGGVIAVIIVGAGKDKNKLTDDRGVVTEEAADNTPTADEKDNADISEKENDASGNAEANEVRNEAESTGDSYEIFNEDNSAKVTVTLPKEYENVTYEDNIGKKLTFSAKSGRINGEHYIDIWFDSQKAEYNADWWKGLHSAACEKNELSQITADDSSEWYCLNQIEDDGDRLLYFFKDLPTGEDDGCICFMVGHYDRKCELEPEDFTDLLCEPTLKIEKGDGIATSTELSEESAEAGSPKLADNEIVSRDFDIPIGSDEFCTKAIVTMPKEYVIKEKTDTYISYNKSDSGNYLWIAFDKNAQERIDFWQKNGQLGNDGVTSETGVIEGENGMKWLYLNQVEQHVFAEDDIDYDKTLYFCADLPTCNEEDPCCIYVKIYNFNGDDLKPEDFTDLLSSSALKIEKYN